MWRAASRRKLLALLALALPRSAPAAPLQPEVPEGGSYGESWTFIADLEGGGYLQLSLGLTNLGPGGVKGLCRAVVVEPGRPPLLAATRVGPESWRAAEGSLTVGPCRARADAGRTGVEVALPEVAVRLEAGAAAPGAAPGGSAEVGADRYRTEVLLFRAPVQASIAPAGEPARERQGAGWIDHTRSTVPPRALARRWVRFRALSDPRPLTALVREGRDGALGPAQVCLAAGCRPVTGLALERGAPGSEAPAAVRLGGPEPLTLRAGAPLYRDAPLEGLGPLRWLAALFYGAPVTWVSRATALGPGGERTEGILEIELDGEG